MIKKLFLLGFIIFAVFAFSNKAQALSGSEFDAGRIIDDSIFTNTSAITADQIDAFIATKTYLGSCDTNGTRSSGVYSSSLKRYYTNAEWGALNGNPAPYVCLPQYRENTATKENNIGNPGKVIVDAKTAGQIIHDAAVWYGINPQVLVVLIQKEQGLVTDHNPWIRQYTAAAGSSCPDGSPCDPTKAGFSTQIFNAAWQFRKDLHTPWLYFIGNNNILWNVSNTGCGSGVVNIKNKATAALYHYTPYQPNAAALANLYGSGDSCSSYGNRNFWRYFNDWFGSTKEAIKDYAWSVQSVDFVKPLGETKLGESQRVVAAIKNTGNQPWPATTYFGTGAKGSAKSLFWAPSWVGDSFAASSAGTAVPVGGIFTFTFDTSIFTSLGNISQNFSLYSDAATFRTNSVGISVNVLPPSGVITASLDTVPTVVGVSEKNKVSFELTNNSSLVLSEAGPLAARVEIAGFEPSVILRQFVTPLAFGQNYQFSETYFSDSVENIKQFTVKICLGAVYCFSPSIDKSIATKASLGYRHYGTTANGKTQFVAGGAEEFGVYDQITGEYRYQSGATTKKQLIVAPISGDQQVLADYNGDGLTDFASYNKYSGTWTIYNDDNTVLSTYILPPARQNLVMLPGDYDGDKKADYSWWDSDNGDWTYIGSINNQKQVLKLGNWTINHDIPVPADYDGDGRLDLAIFRQPTGEWIRVLSANFQLTNINLKSSNEDIPVPHDSDGDKKADIAVFNKSKGLWVIKRTKTGSQKSITLGTLSNNELPAPYDVDGDGLCDVAVYSNITGKVRYIRAVNGYGGNYYFTPPSTSTTPPYTPISLF